MSATGHLFGERGEGALDGRGRKVDENVSAKYDVRFGEIGNLRGLDQVGPAKIYAGGDFGINLMASCNGTKILLAQRARQGAERTFTKNTSPCFLQRRLARITAQQFDRISAKTRFL